MVFTNSVCGMRYVACFIPGSDIVIQAKAFVLAMQCCQMQSVFEESHRVVKAIKEVKVFLHLKGVFNFEKLIVK